MSKINQKIFDELNERTYLAFGKALAQKIVKTANVPYAMLWKKAKEQTQEWEQMIGEIIEDEQ